MQFRQPIKLKLEGSRYIKEFWWAEVIFQLQVMYRFIATAYKPGITFPARRAVYKAVDF